jgi:hypothetical protein
MSHLARYVVDPFPLEMHKARIVQSLRLLPIDERKKPWRKPETIRFY